MTKWHALRISLLTLVRALTPVCVLVIAIVCSGVRLLFIIFLKHLSYYVNKYPCDLDQNLSCEIVNSWKCCQSGSVHYQTYNIMKVISGRLMTNKHSLLPSESWVRRQSLSNTDALLKPAI